MMLNGLLDRGGRRRLFHRGIKVTNSLAYAQGSRGTLDVCRPVGAADAPVVVFFYGGDWRSGNKGLYRYMAKALARAGYVAVVPDYRIYPQARYPDFIDDGALAVRWAKDNARRFGGDPEKLFVMGHSAGAHIAAMLAMDATWLAKVAMIPARDLAGLIGLSGPYDFLPLRDETRIVIFGGANRPETQPIFHVTPGAPPALLLTGGRDTIVEAGNSTRFALRLRECGNDVKVFAYPHLGHFLIIAAFAPFLRSVVPVQQHVDEFIAKTLKSRERSKADRPLQTAET
jgi:acetyl esterase/lipase